MTRAEPAAEMASSFHPRSVQAPSAVVMIRPHHFQPNPQTAADNSFQRGAAAVQGVALAERAHAEVGQAAARLQAAGVTVHLFEDEQPGRTPDSVFPNNWFSTHAGGHVAIYPMYSPNRRLERRADVIEFLKAHYRVQDVIDYSGLEPDGLFLEGTGAMVLDHLERIAYTARSNRANAVALERFCTHFNFEPMVFASSDSGGREIYHTNVLMCIATAFAMVGLDLIPDVHRRNEIADRLRQSGRELLVLSEQQVNEFAGNAMELMGRQGPVLAISTRALAALKPQQRRCIERTATIVHLSVPSIELAGGSVRCMLAGIHLSPRTVA